MEGRCSAQAYILAHPTSQRIVGALKGGTEMSIRDLADKLDYPIDLVAFHLLSLEQHELVERGQRFVNPRERMESTFRATAKVKEAIDGMHTLV